MERIDPRQLLINIAEILDDLDIPYLVTGGMAVVVWGRPRFTADIDIVIELDPPHGRLLENALRALSDKGYIDRSMIEDAIRDNGEFNFIDDVTGVKVDFGVLKKNDAYDRERLQRRVPKTILGKTVYFSSPEDLILIKALWSKESESTRQREDIASIFAISGTELDREYLRTWSAHLGVADALKSFLS